MKDAFIIKVNFILKPYSLNTNMAFVKVIEKNGEKMWAVVMLMVPY